MARRRQFDDGNVDMTPMIDVVFQLIIFFVVTIQLDKEAINEKITLAWAKDGPKIEAKDPRTVTVGVDKAGRVYIGKSQLTPRILTSILRNAGSETPVHVRADEHTEHRHVQRAVDACVRAGIWRVTFVALKDDA